MKKQEKIDKKINKIYKKLELTEEVVKLGTIDTTILTLMIFLMTLILGILSFGVPKPDNNPLFPILIVMYGYTFVLIIPLVFSIIFYPFTIFKKEDRFTNKIRILTILSGTIIFVVGVGILAFIFWFIEINGGPISSSLVGISIFGWSILDVILSISKIGPKIKDYFDSELPNIMTNRKREIKREIRKIKNGKRS